MNADLFRLLGQIKYGTPIPINLPEEIEQACQSIQYSVDKKALEIPEVLKQYARHTFNQVSVEAQNYYRWFDELQSEVKNGMDNQRLQYIDDQLQLYREIFISLDDLKVALLEHLITYFPDEFGNERNIDKLKEWHPRSTVLLKPSSSQESKLNEKPKPKLELKDFFIKDYSTDTVAKIQTEFKELEGKDLAVLIYLLHKEYNIIEILTNSRTKGRKGFVKCLKGSENPSMQKVNKCFVANTDDLNYSKDDLVFQGINKRLIETIEK